jgi:hypothetical protein
MEVKEGRDMKEGRDVKEEKDRITSEHKFHCTPMEGKQGYERRTEGEEGR